jgi:hypothetical protein|tara:strand:- start:763 stop:1017 length:255 start_codon:yes stop_codon:yes gene_type:complete
MQKKTRSLLEELELISTKRDIPSLIESRGTNLISSVINLLEFINRSCSPEQAMLLEKKLLSSIRGKDTSRFAKAIKKGSVDEKQ